VLTAFAFDGTSFTHHLCSSSHVEQMLNLEQSSGVVARLVWEPGFQILNHISFEHRRFNLREPIHVTVSLEDGLWEYQADALGIESFGWSKASAESSFFEDFAVVYDQIARESDDRLTPDAIALKHAFLDVVDSVIISQ
jgi:hypothetical protein